MATKPHAPFGAFCHREQRNSCSSHGLFLWLCYSPIFTGKNDFYKVHTLPWNGKHCLTVQHYKMSCTAKPRAHSLQFIQVHTSSLTPRLFQLFMLLGQHKYLSLSFYSWCFSALKPTLKVKEEPEAKLPCLHMYCPLFLLFLCCIQLVIMTRRDVMFVLKS